MKKQNALRSLSRLLLVSLSGVLTAQAQTSFWWTNNVNGVWNDTAAWSNELGSTLAPTAGGSSDFVITFQNPGAVVTTNDVGTPNFILNQLAFDTGAGAVTIFGGTGTNLVFTTSAGGTLPQVLNNSSSTATLNHGLQLANNTTFGGVGSGMILVSSNITGAGALWKTGANMLTLSANNTYGGGTIVSNGVLVIGAGAGSGNVLGTIGVIPGAALAFFRSDSPTVSNNLSGAGTVAFIGTGGLGQSSYSLTGVNTQTGLMAMTNNARIIVTSQGTLGNPSSILATNGGQVFANGGTYTTPISIAGNGWNESAGQLGAMRLQNATWNGPVTLLGDARITTWSGSSTIGGVISGAYALSFSNNAVGNNIRLSGKNTYSGGTTNMFGTLVLGADNVLGTGPLVMNGGVLSNSASATLTNAIVLGSAGTINGLSNNGVLTLAGPISGSQSLTIKAGLTNSHGVVYLLGSNTFSGNVSVTAGKVVIGNSSALGSGAKTITLVTSATGDPILVLDGSAGAITLPADMSFLTSYVGGVISNAAGNNVINGNFTLTGGGGSTLIIAGSGTLALNGSFTPNTTQRNLQLGGMATGTVNGVIQDGTGANIMSLIKQDSGMWTIATKTTHGGASTVSGGKLLLAAGDNTLSTNAAIIVSGGTLDLGGSTQQTTNFISLQGGIVQNGTLEQTGVNPFDGRAGVVGANLKGSVAFNKGTTGTQLLLGNNQYTGGTVISNGTLGIASVAHVGGAGSTVTFAGGLLQVLGSGVDVDGLNINWNSIPYGSGLDIGNTGIVQVIGSAIGGSSYLTKAGAGTLVLTNANSYSGATIVNAGTLMIGNGGASGSVGTGDITNSGSVVFNRTDSTVLGNNVLGGGTLAVRNGTLTINSAIVTNGTVNVGDAPGQVPTLIITGGTLRPTGNLTVGTGGGAYPIAGKMVVGGGTVSVGGILAVGSVAGGWGALVQTGGVVVATGEFDVGYNNSGAYGFYQLAGGMATNQTWLQAGRSGMGLIYMTGGTNIGSNAGSGLIIGGGSGGVATGVVYVANATSIQVGAVDLQRGNAASRGELTVDAGGLFVAGNASGIRFNYTGSGGAVSVVNLNNGGVLATPIIQKNNAGGLALLNFNGGTLRSLANGTLLAPAAVDGAYFYGNGGALDSSNFNVIVSRNLEAPAGNGVTGVTLGGPLAGYLGAPYVGISGGGGTGATAIAQFDFTTGSVTNILITSAGYGYTGTPNVVLSGGGQTNYYVGLANIAANTPGALTKLGTGTLQLTGTNTYAGGTLINEGMLVFGTTNALGTGLVTINDGGALAMTGAYANAAAWLTSGKLSTNSAGALALAWADSGTSMDFTSVAGGTYSNLYVGALNPMVYTGTLTFRNNDYKLGGGTAPMAVTNDLTANSLTISGASPGGMVGLSGANTITTGVLLNNNGGLSIANAGNLGGSALVISGGTLQIRGATMTDFSGLAGVSTTIPGDFALDISAPGNTFSLASAVTLGGNFTKQGAGTLVLGGSNNITGMVLVGAGALNLQNDYAAAGAGAGILVSNGAALQLQGGITVGAGDTLTLYGTGVANDGALRSISGDNTWAGPVVIGAGPAGRINADAGLLTLSGPVTNNANSVVSFIGGAGNTLISGAIAGPGALGRDGAGTLTLTAPNTFTGGTYIRSGTLVLDFSAVGAPVSNILYNGQAPQNLNIGNGTLKMVSSSTGVSTQYFNSLNLDTTSFSVAGNATVIATNVGSGASVMIFTNAPIRNYGGGVVDFVLPGGGGKIVMPTIVTNSSGTTYSFFTVNGKDFVTLGADKSLQVNTSYTNVPAGGQILTGTNSQMANVRLIDGGAGNITLAAGTTTIQNLLATNSTAVTIDVGAGNTLRLSGVSGTAGGLLLTPDSGGLTIGTAANSGKLTAGAITDNAASDLVIIQNSANDLTINSAYGNNGTGASALTIAGTGAGAVNLNGMNTNTGGFYVNSGTVNLSNTNRLTGSVALRGGTTTFTSTSSNSLGNVYVAGNGILNINGLTTLGGNSLNVGTTTPADRALVIIGTNLNLNAINIGTGNNGQGAIHQTGGALTNATMNIGTASGTYAFYGLSGGTLANTNFWIQVGTTGDGVFYQTGGTNYVTANGMLAGNGSGTGIVYFGGGVYTSSMPFVMGYNNSIGTSRAEVTVDGSADVGINNVLRINQSGTGNTSTNILNLNGGVLQAKTVFKANAGGQSIMNFDGGTLRAGVSSNLFGAGITLDAAFIYDGGAIIDVQGYSVTNPQSLQGVSGFGLNNVTLAGNGAGYIGAPLVQISGGSGTGVTAIAQIDLASGQVTNILITSAGTGYLPTDVLTVTLVGGGYTTAATAGTVNLAANANTGGLTMNGTGSMVLSGTNSYAGLTTITAGTLVFAPTNGAISSIGGLAGAGTMQHAGSGMTVLNGDSSGFSGAATVSNGVLQFATVASVPTSVSGGGIQVDSPGAVSFNFGGGNVQGALTNLNTLSTGVVALTPNSAGEGINFNTTGLSAMYLGAVGTVSYDLANHTPAVAGTYRLGGAGGTLVITNGVTAGSALVVGGGSGAVQAGGSFNLSTLTVNSGSTFLPAGSSQTIGALDGTGTILNTNAAATLTIGDATSTTFGGSINGALGLTKVGAGTLTLTNFNVYNGETLVSAGTLQLSPTGPNQAGLNEGYTNKTVAWAPAVLSNITVATSARWGNVYLGGGNWNYPVFGQTNTWPTNTTIGYTGYVYNNSGSNVIWNFAGAQDDDMRLVIDGNTVISRSGGGWSTNSVTLAPGVHTYDVRFSNGGGSGGAGSGGYIIFSAAYTNLGGLAYDPLGRGTTNGDFYVVPTDPGNGTLFTSGLNILPASTVVQLDPAGTLDLNGAQQLISGLSDPFTAPGAGGLVTNTQAAITSVLNLGPQAGSNYVFSGNIQDAGAASAITITVGGPGGIQTFSGSNTYSGGTFINNGGKLLVTTTNAIPQTGWVTIVSNGTLGAGTGVAINDLLSLGRITNSSAGSVALTQNSGETVDFTLSGGYSNLYLGAVGAVNFSGSLTPANGIVRLGGGGGTLSYNSPITSGLLQIGGGAGTVVLGNIGNSYTNTVINSGTLQVDDDLKLGSIVAGATNILFTGAGTLQAGGNVALDAGRMIVVGTGITGTLDANGYSMTINGKLVGTNATLTKIGAGTVTLGGTTTVTTLNVRNGTLAFNSDTNGVLGNMVVGTTVGDRAVVTVNNNVTVGNILFGNAVGNAGAIYQTGGKLWQTAGSGVNNFQLGAGPNSYGYFKITGGTNIAAEVEVGGANGGYGLYEMYGGFVSNTSYLLISRTASGSYPAGGVVNLFGGTMVLSNMANRFNFMDQGVDNQFGMLSIFSNASLIAGSKELGLNQANRGTGTVIVNLNGGTTMVGRIVGQGGATQVVNLAGGLLKGSTNSGAFFQGATAAYVWDGGANVDDNGQSLTINQNLLAPTGYGVTNITLATAGAGYIGAPLVRILGGSGIGASAIAEIDFASGAVTNILVTSPGSGYLPGDVLTAQLYGGGMTTTATVGTVSLGANNSIGGLNKLGTGTLVLGGSNTYNGTTVIGAGNLQLGSGGASGSLANPNVTFSNTASWLGFNRTDWVTNNLAVQVPNGNIAAIVQNGTGLLVLTNTAPVYNSTAISNGSVFFASTAAIPAGTSNSIVLAKGGGVVVGGAYTTVGDWLASGLITNSGVGGTMVLLGGSSENINLGAYTNLFIGAAQSQVATLTGTLTPATINRTAVSINGVSVVAVNDTPYLLGGGGGTLVIANANALTDVSATTNRALLVGNGTYGVVQVLGPQNYTGGTVISNALLSVTADNMLGPTGGINLQNNGTLQILSSAPLGGYFETVKPVTLSSGTSYIDVGSGMNATFYGPFMGVGSVQKNGSGTLTIGGLFNQVNVGANLSYINAGTVVLTNGAWVNNNAGGSDLNMQSGVTLNVYSNAMLNVATLRVGNSSTGNNNYNQYGGAVTARNYFVIGQNSGNTGTVNMTGGTLVYNASNGGNGLEVGSSGRGTLNISSASIIGIGTAVGNGTFWVAHNAGGTGTVNQSAGSLVSLSDRGGGLVLGGATNTFSTYTLGTGGTLITPKVVGGYTGAGTYRSQFYFTGGTLIANSNNPNFMQNITTVGVAAAGAFINSSNFNVTISNNLAGTGGLTKLGSGTLVLAGVNTSWSGGVTNNEGTLWFARTNAIPGSGANILLQGGSVLAAAGITGQSRYTNVTSWLASGRIATNSWGALGLISNSAENVTMGVFTQLFLGAVSGTNVQYTGTLTPANANYRLAAGAGGNLQMMNANALTGAFGLLVNGPGAVTLAAANDYAGGTVISNTANLVLSNNTAMGTGAANLTNLFGGTLVAGYALDQTTLDRIAPVSAGVVALGVNNANALDFNSGNLSNLSLGAYGAATVSQTGAITPYGSTYRLGGGGGTLLVTNQAALTGAGYNLVAFGGGTGGNLYLTGTNTYGGGTWLGVGGTAVVATVSLGTGAITNNGVLLFNQTFNGTNNNVISGTGSLLATNTGLVTLGGDNSYSGGTLITSNSWLYITHQNALGSGGINVSNAAVLRFGGNLTITNPVVLWGGDGQGKQNDWKGSLQSWTGTNIWAAPITIMVSSRIDAEAGSLFRITKGITGLGGVVLQPQSGANLIVDTTPINLPGNGVTYTGSGTNQLNVDGNNFASASISWGSTVVKLGVDNALPTNVNLTIGATDSSDTAGKPQLWLNGYNQTISNLTVIASNVNNLITLNVGTNTLTVNGDVNVGRNLSNAITRMVVTGPGALVLNKQGGTVQIGLDRLSNQSTGSAGNRATNDMSTLGAFIANLGPTGRFLIGDPNQNGNSMNDLGGRSTVMLATNSIIVAGSLNVGESNQFSSLQTLLLGAGNNIINASTVIVSAAQSGRAQGLIQFNGATGSLALSNEVGGRATMLVMNSVGANTAAAITGTVNTVGHQADFYLSDLLLGNAMPTGTGNNTGERVGHFLFDSGTLDVTRILMGSRNGNAINNTADSYAYLTISGGVARVNQILMATNSSTVNNNGATANAYLNLLGGTVTVSNGITRGLGGGSNGVAVVNLAGADLDMNGSAIGGAGFSYDVTLNATNGTLRSLGELNGGASPLVKAGPGLLRLLGNNTYGGGTLISGGTLQLGDETTLNGTVLGNITNNASLIFANPLAQTYNGVVSGSGNLTKLGAGTLTLGAQNTFAGGTVISNGTVKLASDNALPVLTTVFADTAGAFDLAGYNQQIAGIDGYKGTVTESTTGGRLTVNFANSQSFLGTLTGPGSLTLTGGGTLNLTGTNSFSGATIVSNASLYVNGLHNGGVITVISNGLVGGSGSISALYVNNGGTYAPGNSIATQYVGSLTLTNAGTLLAELGAGAQVNDRTIVTNSLTIKDGMLSLNLAAYSFVQGSEYSLVVWGGASGFNPLDSAQWLTLSDVGGPSNGVLWAQGATLAVNGGTGSNNFFKINYDDVANGHAITLTSVPEPGTASLLGLVGLAFLVRHLRRRFQKQG
jgi:autotransporter-associated beta strand protein